MKRALIFALLAAGCDDDTLPAKVANAQLHGIVAAQARCDCDIFSDGVAYHVTYSAQRLLDGSCLASKASASGDVVLWSRAEPNAADCRKNDVYLQDGEIHMVIPTGDGPRDISEEIEICCTGHNLAAFGVE